ncbi:alcohol dehydrogenase [Silvibacterium dinghuense]|uniref:Alcohol dehydrogenase n=1 Tax=Silvibacterium dinghuense TaxID=1560006 RepID=A0A4Q1SE71_9BACT|nr:alcohol dehydrogenase [Silvibacterium dinghuense]RXS95556.1 alcohol dehydrogenase [Silvibacterium dinghuense]GGH14006.1 alcohol dehydrogenase [Silvibacterium dinghuense]
MAAETRKGRFAQVVSAGGAIEVVIREVSNPAAGHVLVRVEACGVCHSDSITKYGIFPGIQYPRVPGHEVVGRVEAIGDGVTEFKVGQRVGLGWYGGHCGTCEPCRRGDFVCCIRASIPGITYDGGWADYVTAPEEALAAVPESLNSAEAGPLLCAGITTFNALRNSGARPPDVVAILGMGGLGHLGVQYAAKMGYETVAIARGADKALFAKELGAHHYIDSTAQDVAAELKKLGGAKTILATVTDAGAMTAALGGLGYNGKFVVVGVPPEPLQVPVVPLILAKQSVAGWPSGTSIDSEDTLKFSSLTGVKPLIEKYSLDQAADAFARMESGKARFRVVLETGA